MNSERLEQLLKARAIAAARKDVLALISQCSNVKHAEFLDDWEAHWTPVEAGRTVRNYDSVDLAVSRIRINADASEVTEWVVQVLQAMLVENQCLIFVDGYGPLPWLRLTLRGGAEGLGEIWRVVKYKEIFAATPCCSKSRAITEEEHEYLAFEFDWSNR